MLWQLALIGLGLAVNNAVGSVALGAMKMKRTAQLRIALIFALFEALMPVIGMVIGIKIASLIGRDTKYIGMGILILLGIYLLVKRDDGDEGTRTIPSGLYIIFLAITLSLDNLTVGFGLGMLGFSMQSAGIMFGSISLVMTLAGLELGRLLGKKVDVSADKLSGFVLIATGILMVVG